MNANKTARQERLIAALLTADTLKQAAQQADVPYETARRYLRDPAVVEALTERRQEVAREAVLEAASLAQLARETLRQVMQDERASTHARVRAAEAALAYARAIDDLFDVDARLATLEAEAEAQRDERDREQRSNGRGYGGGAWRMN